ncbi:MAG: thioredoxin domain-containing protein [Pseudomonadota bacterium]|nr:thioredoxin domain-containing protein [Pseudomonadota bacterium]
MLTCFFTSMCFPLFNGSKQKVLGKHTDNKGNNEIMIRKLTMAAMVLATTATAQAEDLTKKDVEQIVHDYITQNGGVIASSVDSYLADQRRLAAADYIDAHTPVVGNPDAEVLFIEFSDFRCGYCRRVQDTLQPLREKYSDQVRFAFKNMPILSEESRAAALAALAANKQDKFWEYTSKLWENQPRLGDDLFVEIAKELELDVEKFNADRASQEIFDQAQKDFMDGQEAGVQGTPHFVIDGNPLSGAQPLENFEKAIKEAIEANKEQ